MERNFEAVHWAAEKWAGCTVRRHLHPAPSLDLNDARRVGVIMSGWGEAGARGDWYANQDFSFKSLTVQKGEKLPSAWQVPQNARYLRDTYGEQCITYKSQTKSAHRPQQNGNEEGEWVPVQQEPDVIKKQKQKK